MPKRKTKHSKKTSRTKVIKVVTKTSDDILQDDKNLQENVALQEENAVENVAESLPEIEEEKSEGKLEGSSDVLDEALEKIDDSSKKMDDSSERGVEDNLRESEISRESEIEGQKKESWNEKADLLKKKASATAQLEKQLKKDRKKIKRKSKRAGEKDKSETRVPLWTKIVIIVLSLIIVLLISVAIFGYMLLSHTANVFKGNPMDILIGTELARDENNLTNVLIFGTSEDAEGHGGGLLTDSILVASIDQDKKTSKIFSIPRDLWVNYTVPGGDVMNCVVGTQGKINATYMCALNEYKNNRDQASRYFARKISEITGLSLHYYVALDWSALKTVVDELGGIDVDVYADDENGIHDTCQHLDLPRGMNYGLDGNKALKLARARNAGCDNGGDFGLSRSNFDREINQQRIFNAIKNKAFSMGLLTKPTKVIRLIDSLGNNVKTNITMAEVRTLIDVATNLEGEVQSIPTVDQFGVGRIGVQSVVLPRGASVYNMSSLFNYGDFQRYLRKTLLN